MSATKNPGFTLGAQFSTESGLQAQLQTMLSRVFQRAQQRKLPLQLLEKLEAEVQEFDITTAQPGAPRERGIARLQASSYKLQAMREQLEARKKDVQAHIAEIAIEHPSATPDQPKLSDKMMAIQQHARMGLSLELLELEHQIAELEEEDEMTPMMASLLVSRPTEQLLERLMLETERLQQDEVALTVDEQELQGHVQTLEAYQQALAEHQKPISQEQIWEIVLHIRLHIANIKAAIAEEQLKVVTMQIKLDPQNSSSLTTLQLAEARIGLSNLHATQAQRAVSECTKQAPAWGAVIPAATLRAPLLFQHAAPSQQPKTDASHSQTKLFPSYKKAKP